MAQFLRPDSDIAVGTWTTTPLFSKVNDQSNTTFIRSSNSNGDTCTLGLSNPSANPNAGSIFVQVLASKPDTGGTNPTLDITVLQGGVIVQTFTVTVSTAAWQTFRFQVTNPITDFNNLSVSLNRYGGGNPQQRKAVDAAEVFLEIPDPAAVNVTASAGLISFVETIPVATVSAQQSVTASAGLISFTETLYDVSISLVAQVHVTVPSNPIPYSLTALETTVSTQVSTVVTAGLISFTGTIYDVTVVVVTPPVITSLAVWDADTDTEIAEYSPMTEGMSINEAQYPNFNIIAYTDPQPTGSVNFDVTGATIHSRMESVAPYFAWGDSSGDVHIDNTSLGEHTIAATPYTESSGGGTAGEAYVINFSVVNERIVSVDAIPLTENLLAPTVATQVSVTATAGLISLNESIFDVTVEAIAAGSETVLYRIDVGAQTETAAIDGDINWEVDNAFYNVNNTGNTFQTTDPIDRSGVDANIFPEAVFQTEKWDAGTDEIDLVYEFPITDAGNYRVDILLAELYHETVGFRVFDIYVQGVLEWENVDIYALAGHDVALVLSKTVAIAANGTLSVWFDHGTTENPKVNGLQVVKIETGGGVIAGTDLLNFVETVPAVTISTVQNTAVTAGLIEINETVYDAAVSTGINITIPSEPISINATLLEITISAVQNSTPTAGLIEFISATEPATVTTQKAVTVPAGLLQFDVAIEAAAVSTGVSVTAVVDAVEFTANIPAATTSTEVNVIAAAGTLNFISTVFEATCAVEVHTTISADTAAFNFSLPAVNVSAGGSASIIADGNLYQIGVPEASVNAQRSVTVDLGVISHQISLQEAYASTSGTVLVSLDIVHFETEILPVNVLKEVTIPVGEIQVQAEILPVTVSSGATVAVAALVSEFEIGLEPVTVTTSAQAIVDVESLGIILTAEEVQIITSGEVIATVDALEFQTEVFNVLVNPAPPTVSEGNVMLSGNGRVILFRGRY